MKHRKHVRSGIARLVSLAFLAVLVLNSTLAAASTASAETRRPSSDPATSWNQFLTQLAQAPRLNPIRLARAYALVHVAIYDALLASRGEHQGDEEHGGHNGELSGVAVAAGAASEVLTYLFPARASLINEQEQAQAGSDLAGLNFGHTVGTAVVGYGQSDGSNAVFTGPIPTGNCIWSGVNPLEPMTSTWKTWILTSGAGIQPEAPYACGSEADLRDVQAVVDAQHALTPERIAVVHKWGDVFAPTIWNNILNEQIANHGMSLLRSARAHAYLNIAIYDALVSTWFTKFNYWTARPFQRIPGFLSIIPTPNFPGYTSAHSTVSGAASVVLGKLFPSMRDYFAGQADEAALSRLWGGIHFPHDNEQGLVVGRAVGAEVVEDMRQGAHTFVFSGDFEG